MLVLFLLSLKPIFVLIFLMGFYYSPRTFFLIWSPTDLADFCWQSILSADNFIIMYPTRRFYLVTSWLAVCYLFEIYRGSSESMLHVVTYYLVSGLTAHAWLAGLMGWYDNNWRMCSTDKSEWGCTALLVFAWILMFSAWFTSHVDYNPMFVLFLQNIFILYHLLLFCNTHLRSCDLSCVRKCTA